MSQEQRNEGAGWRRIWTSAGGIRAGWRLLLFLALVIGCRLAVWPLVDRLGYEPVVPWRADVVILEEAIDLLIVLAVVLGMGRLEGRSLRNFGLSPPGGRAAVLLGEGALWGAAAPAAVVLLLWLAGGIAFHGLSVSGSALLWSTVLWAVAFLGVGLHEELLFRGYFQRTLSDGIGFWPAALAVSVLFGALHYFLKPDESWLDALNVSLLGLFLCLALARTGDLWFPIGFHMGFNFSQMFVFGAPNSGNESLPVADHLLATTYQGPRALSGGGMGLQASALLLPVLVVLFVGLHLRYREVRLGGWRGAGPAWGGVNDEQAV